MTKTRGPGKHEQLALFLRLSKSLLWETRGYLIGILSFVAAILLTDREGNHSRHQSDWENKGQSLIHNDVDIFDEYEDIR